MRLALGREAVLVIGVAAAKAATSATAKAALREFI